MLYHAKKRRQRLSSAHDGPWSLYSSVHVPQDPCGFIERSPASLLSACLDIARSCASALQVDVLGAYRCAYALYVFSGKGCVPYTTPPWEIISNRRVNKEVETCVHKLSAWALFLIVSNTSPCATQIIAGEMEVPIAIRFFELSRSG